jgi:hypothetical protein
LFRTHELSLLCFFLAVIAAPGFFDNSYNFKKSDNKQQVLPTFNLSYLLKRPETKRQAWEDMKMLRDKIKETIET